MTRQRTHVGMAYDTIRSVEFCNSKRFFQSMSPLKWKSQNYKMNMTDITTYYLQRKYQNEIKNQTGLFLAEVPVPETTILPGKMSMCIAKDLQKVAWLLVMKNGVLELSRNACRFGIW